MNPFYTVRVDDKYGIFERTIEGRAEAESFAIDYVTWTNTARVWIKQGSRKLVYVYWGPGETVAAQLY